MKSPRPIRGYSLIEMILVLVIISILTLVAVSRFTSRSTAAVRSALIDIRGGLQQARQLAMSSGRPVLITSNLTTGSFKVRHLSDAGLPLDPPLLETALDRGWEKRAKLTTDDPIIAGEIQPAQNVEAINTFLNAGVGWNTPLDPAAWSLGFTQAGLPVRFAVTGGTAYTMLSNGTWLGVLGSHIADEGKPYGLVVVSPQGHINAYYKNDHLLAEPTWKRLD